MTPLKDAESQEEVADPDGDVDVPPAPEVIEEARNTKPKSFDWLQRALQLN